VVVSRLHAIGIKLVDLLILTVLLVIITGSVITSGDVIQLVHFDFLNLFLIVVGTYLAVCVIIGVLVSAITTDTFIGRFAKTAISGLLMILLFPVLIEFLMWFLQYSLSADSANTLFWGTLIRTLVRSILGKYWDSNVT